jgi:hypothetical protein
MRRPGYSLLQELVLLNREARQDAVSCREFGAATDLLAESMIIDEAQAKADAIKATMVDVLADGRVTPDELPKLARVGRELGELT